MRRRRRGRSRSTSSPPGRNPVGRFGVSRPFDASASVGLRRGFQVSGGPEAILRQGAVLWLDALYSNAGQTATNLGTGGTALNATLGSTASADSNDPLWLANENQPYVYLPGANSNYLSVPDSAALDITGDLDLRVWCALDDWTPAAIQILIGKREVNQIAYQMAIDTTGNVRLLWSTNGTVGILATSTAATGVADGTAKWVRATLDVDNGAAGYSVQFFLSDNGTSWTQLGTTVTVAGVTSIFASTANLNVGARNSGGAEPAAGKFYRAQVLNGIGGTVVCDVNMSVLTSGTQTTFTESSSNAATVTVNRATSGRKTVLVIRQPVWLFGTDDYMDVSDNALLDFDATDTFTIVAVVRDWQSTAAGAAYVSKKNNESPGTSQAGYYLWRFATTAYGQVFDGTTFPGNATRALSNGPVQVLSFNRSGSPKLYNVGVNTNNGSNVTDTTSASLANSLPLRIGALGSTGGAFGHFELMAVAIFRRVLTAAELAQIVTYYQTRYV